MCGWEVEYGSKMLPFPTGIYGCRGEGELTGDGGIPGREVR